jgi:hypothetical protein
MKKTVLCLVMLLFCLTGHAFASGWSNYYQIAGVGSTGEGASMALVNLDSDPRPELVFLAYDAPDGANNFRYKIGWNVSAYGTASWSDPIQVAGVGNSGQGAGITFTNLDGDPRPEMILMAYDAPSGANTFRYRIGWNVGSNGIASSWSGVFYIAGVGNEGQGAGVACINLDSDPRPEMILMAYDNPDGGNSFRYRVGWNVGSTGAASWWGSVVYVDGVGATGNGADLTFAQFDSDPRPEMVLMAYDAPDGANNFRYKIGWNVGTDGLTASWSSPVQVDGVGATGEGAGLGFYDFDGNGRMDMVLMAYDAPTGANTFRYKIGWDLMTVNNFVVTLNTLWYNGYIPPTQIPSSPSTQTGPNLYQLSDQVVHDTAYEAAMDYVNDCRANPAVHVSEVSHRPDLAGHPELVDLADVLSDSDLLVAAIAWFVDRNMTWSDDAHNEPILNNTFGLNYHPGWDFPIPANYPIRYTGDAIFTSTYGYAPDRFHGDCEDHAILRAALLRALGMNPSYVWNVMDNPVTHEYNVVAYRGAFRIMDYGPIGRWLATHMWDSHRSYYGYNENYGPRYPGPFQHLYLAAYANNYPGGAPLCQAWSYLNYYQDTCR